VGTFKVSFTFRVLGAPAALDRVQRRGCERADTLGAHG